MIHVLLFADPTLAYCGCGGWIDEVPGVPETRRDCVALLAELWRKEHFDLIFQPGKDATLEVQNADLGHPISPPGIGPN